MDWALGKQTDRHRLCWLFLKRDSWKMEILRIFGSWNQQIDSWFTNHETLIPTLLNTCGGLLFMLFSALMPFILTVFQSIIFTNLNFWMYTFANSNRRKTNMPGRRKTSEGVTCIISSKEFVHAYFFSFYKIWSMPCFYNIFRIPLFKKRVFFLRVPLETLCES